MFRAVNAIVGQTQNTSRVTKEKLKLDYGVHLPVIDFGFERFSLERLCAYVRKAEEPGFKAVSTNDHLIYSRPWRDAPTVLAAVLAHTVKMAVGTSVALLVVRGPVQVAKALAAIDILSNGRLFGDQEKKPHVQPCAAYRGWRLFVGKNRSNLSLNGNSSTEPS